MELNAKFEKDIVRCIERMGVESDLVDFQSLWNNQLTYLENKERIVSFCQNLSPYASEDMNQKFYTTKPSDVNALMLAIDDDPDDITKYFTVQRDLINATLTSDKVNAIILRSPPGLGKTHLTLECLNKGYYLPEVDYSLVAGYTTPLRFYEKVYNMRHGIIVLDDVYTVFEDKKMESMLLAMLWSPDGHRVVSYDSSSQALKEDTPPEFEFEGKMIMLANTIPSRLKALISRCYLYEFNYEYPTKIEMMYGIAKKRGWSKETVDYIRENTSPQTPDVDFRLLFKVQDLKENCQNWKELTLALLKSNNEKAMLKEILENYDTQKQQIEQYKIRTGMSRRSFFRRLEEMRNE